MRWFQILTVPVVVLALAGCGGSDNSFPFRSLAAEPSGEAVKIRYDMEPGEAVRLTMHGTGRIEATGPVTVDAPVTQDLEMVMRCTQRLPDGGLELEYEIASFSMSMPGVPGGDAAQASLDGIVGTKLKLQLAPNGQIKDLDLGALAGPGSQQIKELFNRPGFQTFVPMPEGGMRVGEAIDIATIMPAESLEQLMEKSVPGGGIKPKLEGEMVLKAVREVDGEQAAEFAVNVVMNLKGSFSKGSEDADMDMGMRVTGTSLTSLRTGMPIGSGSSRMELRMDMEAGDVEMSMRMNMDMQITAKRE